MATKSNTRTRSKTTQEKKPTVVEEVVENNVQEVQRLVLKDIDPEQYVIVRNGFQGRLVYKSKRTGEKFVWGAFGDEQEMTLRELRNAKNSYKAFFTNNYFMFDEPWVVDYLGVKQFYKNAISIDDFDEIFELPANELKQRISGLSKGQRMSVIYRARQLILDEKIDSRKTIQVLEEALGVELVER